MKNTKDKNKASIHSASVTVLKNQVNSVLPFRERRGLANSKASGKGTKTLNNNQQSMQQVRNYFKINSVNRLEPHDVVVKLNSRQNQQYQTVIVDNSNGCKDVASMTAKKNSVPMKDLKYKASFQNTYSEQVTNSEADRPVSQNQKRHLKSTFSKNQVHKLLNENVKMTSKKVVGQKTILAKPRPLDFIQRNNEAIELDFYSEARRSFSPCALPSTVNLLRESIDKPLMTHCHPEVANKLPEKGVGLLTDPTPYYKDHPTEERKQFWSKARNKELLLSMSSSQRQVQPTTLSRATVSFKKGISTKASSSNVAKHPSIRSQHVLMLSPQHIQQSNDNISKKKYMQKLLLSKPSHQNMLKFNNKDQQVHHRSNFNLIQPNQAQTPGAPPLMTRDRKHTSSIQFQSNCINSPIGATERQQNLNGFEPLVEVDSMDYTPGTYRKKRQNNSTSRSKQSKQSPEPILSKDIRMRLKAQHLGHVIEDNNNFSAKKSHLVSSTTKLQCKKEGNGDSSIPVPRLLPKSNSQQRVLEIQKEPLSDRKHKVLTKASPKNNRNILGALMGDKAAAAVIKQNSINRDIDKYADQNNDSHEQLKKSIKKSGQKRQQLTQPAENKNDCQQLFVEESSGDEGNEFRVNNRCSPQQPKHILKSDCLKSPQTVKRPKKSTAIRNKIGAASTQRHGFCEQDDFLVREQRLRDKLKMFQEKDQMKVIHKLSQQKQNRPLRQLSHQFSTLMPVQNYTSTNDNLYKETIEARKIREAIGKVSDTMKHAPVSIVEKKKHQRIINAIEQDVVLNPKKYQYLDQQQQHGDIPMLSSPTNGTQVVHRSSMMQTTSFLPVHESESPPCIKIGGGSPQPGGILAFTAKNPRRRSLNNVQEEEENSELFQLTTRVESGLQVYTESVHVFDENNEAMAMTDAAVTMGNTAQVFFGQQEPSPSNSITKLNKIKPARQDSLTAQKRAQAEQIISQNQAQLAFPHRTLTVLMRKAAKFERESKPVIAQTRQSQKEKDGLVRMAEKFTNKEHFQKTFMRQSAFQGSPSRIIVDSQNGSMPTQAVMMSNNSEETAGYSSDRGMKSKLTKNNEINIRVDDLNESPPRQNVAQKEDRSFFMRMQRQYSQKQLLLTQQSKTYKEPYLLYANKPQIIRKDSHSPQQKNTEHVKPREISPQKIKTDKLTTTMQNQESATSRKSRQQKKFNVRNQSKISSGAQQMTSPMDFNQEPNVLPVENMQKVGSTEVINANQQQPNSGKKQLKLMDREELLISGRHRSQGSAGALQRNFLTDAIKKNQKKFLNKKSRKHQRFQSFQFRNSIITGLKLGSQISQQQSSASIVNNPCQQSNKNSAPQANTPKEHNSYNFTSMAAFKQAINAANTAVYQRPVKKTELSKTVHVLSVKLNKGSDEQISYEQNQHEPVVIEEVPEVKPFSLLGGGKEEMQILKTMSSFDDFDTELRPREDTELRPYENNRKNLRINDSLSELDNEVTQNNKMMRKRISGHSVEVKKLCDSPVLQCIIDDKPDHLYAESSEIDLIEFSDATNIDKSSICSKYAESHKESARPNLNKFQKNSKQVKKRLSGQPTNYSNMSDTPKSLVNTNYKKNKNYIPLPVLQEVASLEPTPQMNNERSLKEVLGPMVTIPLNVNRRQLSRPINSTYPSDLYNSFIQVTETDEGQSHMDKESPSPMQMNRANSPKFSTQNSDNAEGRVKNKSKRVAHDEIMYLSQARQYQVRLRKDMKKRKLVNKTTASPIKQIRTSKQSSQIFIKVENYRQNKKLQASQSINTIDLLPFDQRIKKSLLKNLSQQRSASIKQKNY